MSIDGKKELQIRGSKELQIRGSEEELVKRQNCLDVIFGSNSIARKTKFSQEEKEILGTAMELVRESFQFGEYTPSLKNHIWRWFHENDFNEIIAAIKWGTENVQPSKLFNKKVVVADFHEWLQQARAASPTYYFLKIKALVCDKPFSPLDQKGFDLIYNTYISPYLSRSLGYLRVQEATVRNALANQLISAEYLLCHFFFAAKQYVNLIGQESTLPTINTINSLWLLAIQKEPVLHKWREFEKEIKKEQEYIVRLFGELWKEQPVLDANKKQMYYAFKEGLITEMIFITAEEKRQLEGERAQQAINLAPGLKHIASELQKSYWPAYQMVYVGRELFNNYISKYFQWYFAGHDLATIRDDVLRRNLKGNEYKPWCKSDGFRPPFKVIIDHFEREIIQNCINDYKNSDLI